MIYLFGERSLKKLNTCDPKLIAIANRALSYELIDFAIIEGYRSDERQHQFFIDSTSKLDAGDPKAKHNFFNPSHAFDAAPFVNDDISWDQQHCIFLAGCILSAAKELGVELRWGGNWDMDGEIYTDQQFQDLVHYEIVI